MTKVSVIMPVFHVGEYAERYVEKAIDSILEQTFVDFEFIIVNEFGTNEKVTNILKSYETQDERINLIQNQKKLGISASLNIGLDLSSGKYIARMDADDISLPERLATQVKFMDDNLDVALCGTFVENFGDVNREWDLETKKEQLRSNMLFYTPCVHPTVMFRKEILNTNNIRYNETFSASEDYDIFSKICKVSHVANVDKVLFRYRWSENSATFQNNNIGYLNYLAVMKGQFIGLNLDFTEEELKLLSPHFGFKGMSGTRVIESLVTLDLLLKQILVANEKVKRFSRRELSHSLYKRYKEVYESLTWACTDYDEKKAEDFYNKSIFSHEYFYESTGKKYNKLISVLMPTFNSEKYVADTIWSILEQSFEDFEFLIINEFGSDDDTVTIINMFADNRIRLIQNKDKLGLADSLNLGLNLAESPYIARVDADDLYHKNRLQLQFDFMEKHPDYGVCGSRQHHFGIDTDHVHAVPLEHHEIKAHLIFYCELCHSTLLLRKKFFVDNNLKYDKSKYAEDYELWTRSVQLFKFANLEEVLGEYRITGDNITHEKFEKLSTESGQIASYNLRECANVTVPETHVAFLTNWVNKFNEIVDIPTYKKILKNEEKILRELYQNNLKLKHYDNDALLYVITRRWKWVLNQYNLGIDFLPCKDINSVFKVTTLKKNTLTWSTFFKFNKKNVKKMLYLFYFPLKKYVIDKFQRQLWDLDGHLKDVKNEILDSSRKNAEQVESIVIRKLDEQLAMEVTDLKNFIEELMCGHEKNIFDRLENRIYEAEKLVNQTMDNRIYEAEKLVNQTMDNRIYEAEKLVNQTMDGRIWKAEERLVSDNSYYISNVHRHIDFTYRDLMIILQKQFLFVEKPKITLETNHQIAYESLDYKYPHGTIRDNTRYPRFIEKCESLFTKNKKLKFLDLGCSGGGMVLEAGLRGHISVGLEGSDASFKQQRAEWRLIPDNLFTCDITKDFFIKNDKGEQELFDIITAWEVLEHIQERDLDQLLKNIFSHLSIDGYFIASVANYEDFDTKSNVNLHVTMQDKEWWVKQFQKNGFNYVENLINSYDLARGGINGPNCYEINEENECDDVKCFYIVMKK